MRWILVASFLLLIVVSAPGRILRAIAAAQGKDPVHGPAYWACGAAVNAFVGLAGLYWQRYRARALQAKARRLRGECPLCGYNLTGNVSGTCPECGAPVLQRRKSIR
ncbi:MAG TPA: hypothetical protein VGI81_03030 [Tepidisphaeraceae bacterium]|jgi:predicted RNA-binding Zn-ribbon protein involved in translation (DUF1610 family)